MISAEQSESVLHVFDLMSTAVIKVKPDDTVHLAVARMIKKDVGCTVVVGTDEKPVGIITKGDVLRRAFLKRLDSKKIKVSRIMTKPVIATKADASVEEVAKIMAQKGVSKLPVMKDQKMVGVISSTDIIRSEPATVGYLQELVRARYVPHDLR